MHPNSQTHPLRCKNQESKSPLVIKLVQGGRVCPVLPPTWIAIHALQQVT